MLAVDVFPSVDGHAQKRSSVRWGATNCWRRWWIEAPTGFARSSSYSQLPLKKAILWLDSIKVLPWQATDDFRLVGQSDRAIVFEQNIIMKCRWWSTLIATSHQGLLRGTITWWGQRNFYSHYICHPRSLWRCWYPKFTAKFGRSKHCFKSWQKI